MECHLGYIHAVDKTLFYYRSPSCLIRSGLNQNLKSNFYSNRSADEGVLPAEKLQKAEEFKDGQKSDYTVTEESV
jgi:hypothetical protein